MAQCARHILPINHNTSKITNNTSPRPPLGL